VRILAVSGSLQARSGNLALLRAAARSSPEGVDLVVFEGLGALPAFNPDTEGDPPPAVLAWRRALAESDAMLIASPEYGMSLPGALKNGIDWVIGSGELERKPVAITAAVNHPDRGRHGLQALSDTLGAVSARIVGGRPLVKGPSFDKDVADLVVALVEEAKVPEDAPDHGLGIAIRPSALVLAWVDAFNRADVDRLVSLYARDAVNHQVTEAPLEGRAAIRQMFVEAFAGATMVCIVENLFEDGPWAMLEWRDPKGLRGCGFFQVRKGLIVLQRGYWDKLSFLRQQGLPLPTE
jgi:NAD(P)H-dependent FMN reductase